VTIRALRVAQLREASRPVLLAAAALSLALICYGQWALLDGGSRVVPLIAYIAGLVAFVQLQAPCDEPDVPLVLDDTRPPLASGWLFVTPLAVSAAASAVVWYTGWERLEDTSHLDVVLAWLLSIGALLMAATPAGWVASSRATARRMRQRSWRCWGPPCAVVAVAAAARLVSLGSFPSMEMDGMALTLIARKVSRGTLDDPFTTGWLDNPTMYAFLQSGTMQIFGETVTSARLLSALAGTLGVVAVYCWSRRRFGRNVALGAAALLATMPMHIYFSRVALNLVEDSLSLIVVLWLFDRAITRRRALDAVLAGFALGFAQYFYFSARFLVPLVAVLTVAGAAWWWRALGSWRAGVRAMASPAAWLWAAAAIVAMPLIAHYVEQPQDFNSRSNTVSALGPWLDAEMERTGRGEVEIIAGKLGDAALLPFATPMQGQYHPPPPLVGWPLAVPVALGLAVVTRGALRRRYAGIAVAWWASLAAVGLTIGVNAQRWVLATPLVALCAALGIDRVRRVAVLRLGVHRRVAGAGMVVAVVAMMAWGTHFVFRDANIIRVWSDPNSQVAEQFAHALADEPAGTQVYTAFAPRMYFASHPGVPFLAPQVNGVDILDPITRVAQVPATEGRTVFAFLPERLVELEEIRGVYPGGSIEEFVDRSGNLSLVLYTVIAE
jgi:4-amino-4-deoxy-L-arabinose transferase-like glycosyltransferase